LDHKDQQDHKDRKAYKKQKATQVIQDSREIQGIQDQSDHNLLLVPEPPHTESGSSPEPLC
jgi:hypothetical protein